MESYQQDIINRCKNLSSNINEYFNEEQYRVDVEQAEEITPDFLVKTAVDMVLEELKVIGIESNFDSIELINSPVDLEIMFYLRSKFDTVNFYNLLKALDESNVSALTQIIEDVELSEDMLIEITNFFSELLTKDVGWDYIARSLNHWFSTDEFTDHISTILDKLFNSTDPNKVYISDENIDVVKHFVEIMQERATRLELLANYILKQYPFVSRSKLMILVNRYDKDKLDPNRIAYFAAYTTQEHVEGETEPSFVYEHHKRTSHHIEYWREGVGFEKNQKISVEHACMIVMSEMIENKSKSDIKKNAEMFKQFCDDKADVDVYNFMMSLTDIDYESVLVGGAK